MYGVGDLPRIDAIFITNTHLDYLDKPTIEALYGRFEEDVLWYVPLGVADMLKNSGINNVIEMDWWKEDEVDFVDHPKVKLGNL